MALGRLRRYKILPRAVGTICHNSSYMFLFSYLIVLHGTSIDHIHLTSLYSFIFHKGPWDPWARGTHGPHGSHGPWGRAGERSVGWSGSLMDLCHVQVSAARTRVRLGRVWCQLWPPLGWTDGGFPGSPDREVHVIRSRSQHIQCSSA